MHDPCVPIWRIQKMKPIMTKTTTFSHPHRVSLIPAMRSEASEPRRTLLSTSARHTNSASPLRLCVRFLLSAVILFLLSACSDQNGKDDPDNPGFEEGIPTEVRITLSVRSGNGTRSGEDGSPKDPTSSVELMHDGWWIVFIDKKNTVRVIGQKDNDVTDRVKSLPSSVANPDGFEAETFKIILPSGTYRVYAFANVPQMTVEQFEAFRKKDSNPWKHGTVHLNDILGDDKFITDTDGSQDDGMQWPSDKNIPMTGVMPEVKIKNTVEEAINIEVIRAVAKVEFAFTNSTTETITLKKLEFSPISKCGKISFVPNNEVLGFGPNDKLITDKVEFGALSFDLSSELTTDNPSYTFGFYCNESLPHDKDQYNKNQKEYDNSKDYTNLYKNQFTIDLTIDKNGTAESKRLYTSKITYINRNDWIKIPITFGDDWKIRWNLRMYPPIGGYPPEFTQNEEGTVLNAKVNIGGEFELYPFEVMKGSGGENLASEVDWDKVTVTVLSGSELFIMPPTLEPDSVNADSKVIAGVLDPNKEGVAKVRIDFKLQENTQIDSELSCTLTITREN